MASLACFAPHVQCFVKEVLKQGKVGICPGTISVVSPSSGQSSFGKKVLCDRFKLIIPYGGHTVTWEVLFHANHPEFPPDFIFSDCAFRPQLEDLESLCTWKPNDSTCFLKVIQELIAAFRKQEVEHLEQYSRLQFEYSSLVQQTGFTDDDVEVFMTHKSRGGPVSFLIRLPVDFSKIPPILTKDNPGEDSAVLLVTFQTPEGSRITPQLFLSPKVEHTLGGSQALRIPSFPSGGCLMDYVPSIRQLLVNKVDQIVQGFEKRKEYIASFLSHFGRCVIEYDAESFSKMAFLFEWNDFYFLLHITLPLYFPQDKPSFIFQSVYHANLGRPYSVTCSDYPYSPRWSAQEMSERAKSFFLEYIAVFQRSSIKNKG